MLQVSRLLNVTVGLLSNNAFKNRYPSHTQLVAATLRQNTTIKTEVCTWPRHRSSTTLEVSPTAYWFAAVRVSHLLPSSWMWKVQGAQERGSDSSAVFPTSSCLASMKSRTNSSTIFRPAMKYVTLDPSFFTDQHALCTTKRRRGELTAVLRYTS